MSVSPASPRTVALQAPLSVEFPGKNTGVDFHFLLQGIFLDQGSNLCLLHWQADSLPLSHWESSNFCCCLIITGYGSVKKFSCLGLGHSFYACIYKCISFHTHRGFCLDSLVSRTGLVGSCTNHAARGHSRTVLGPTVS